MAITYSLSGCCDGFNFAVLSSNVPGNILPVPSYWYFSGTSVDPPFSVYEGCVLVYEESGGGLLPYYDNIYLEGSYADCTECTDRYPCPAASPTPTPTQTPTPTKTPTQTPTVTKTPTRSPAVTRSSTPTNTQTPTLTPTNTSTPTLTPTNTPTNSVTPTVTPSSDTPTPTPTPTVTPTNYPSNFQDGQYLRITGANECQVITLFPLGVSCESTPSLPRAGQGTINLTITGGTPPYTVCYQSSTNGSRPICSVSLYQINNLNPGSYTITVSDLYGDFNVQIECVVDSLALSVTPTPTTTPTPTVSPTIGLSPTPTPTISPSAPCDDLCLVLTPNTQQPFWCGGGTLSTINVHFTRNGNDSNGYPKWVVSSVTTSPNVPGTYFVGFELKFDLTTSKWRIYDSLGNINLTQSNPFLPGCSNPSPTIGTQIFQIYSSNANTPSNNSWIINVGDNSQANENYFAEVYQITNFDCGNCGGGTSAIVGVKVTKTDPQCLDNGSITLVANGGTPPYFYTINANSPTPSYSPIPVFQGLGSGTYFVAVKDSSTPPIISAIQTITLNSSSAKNYRVIISKNEQIIQNINLNPSFPNFPRFRYVKRMNFSINVLDNNNQPLQVGESVTFDLTHYNISNIRPFIWDCISLGYGPRVGDSYPINLNVIKNGINITPVSINDQVYSTSTSGPAPVNQTSTCKDQFDINQGGNRVLSCNYQAAPINNPTPYVTFSSGTTSTYNSITFQNGDVINGYVDAWLEETPWVYTRPINWTTGNQFDTHFLECEILRQVDYLAVTNIQLTSSSVCDTIDPPSQVSMATDINSVRNPNNPNAS